MYEVPKSQASIAQNRFEFSIDGNTYSIPLMKFLPVKIVAEMEDGGIKAVLAAFGDTAPAVGELDTEQLEGLSKAWSDASGIDVGESSASEDS